MIKWLFILLEKGGCRVITMWEIGTIHIYWYGITVSFSIIVGMVITWLNVVKRKENFSVIIDMLLCTIPAGIVCSRVIYVFFHWPEFSYNIYNIVMLNKGGMSVYGAFAGLLLGTLVYTYVSDRDFWFWLDVLTPGMIAGLMVNQIGNFCMQNTIGSPFPISVSSNHALAVYLQFKQRPAGFENYLYYRPVALYQAGALGIILLYSIALTYMQVIYNKISYGTIFLSAIILATGCRFYFGFMYLSTHIDISLHTGQYIALLIMAACGIIYYYRKKKIRNKNTYHY
ncbi:prolipoprotein diacylglyceryl transferase [Pectinatus sottacetonis]|uniref:prolipoprotein diacylglyceryl transferase n=1 Tax=Pectinatus sottacetonis TaxID=1002795 RepID=UPI0018C4FA58|nr:prolipoprotein diacylglyceryl transferase family protein [Pectinatus sottacetonis]